MTQLAPTPVFKAFDNNGNPLFGGLLYSYAAGATTPQATYTDSTGSTPNTNPVTLNARGECNLWLDPALAYKLTLTDSAGNQIWSVDNIQQAGTQIFTNIADMRLQAGVFDGQPAQLNGYYTEGDGGGGSFFWNATSIAADNGGTIIAPTGVSTGRWYRVYSGTLSAKWFGAKGDGVTDDTSALNSAITAAQYQVLFIPEGTYVTSTALTVKDQSVIQGVGDGNNCTKISYIGTGSCINAFGTGTDITNGTPVSNISISGIQITTSTGQYGINANIIQWFILERVTIIGFSVYALTIGDKNNTVYDKFANVEFRFCDFAQCTSSIYIGGGSALVLRKCSATGFTVNGVLCEDASDISIFDMVGGSYLTGIKTQILYRTSSLNLTNSINNLRLFGLVTEGFAAGDTVITIAPQNSLVAATIQLSGIVASGTASQCVVTTGNVYNVSIHDCTFATNPVSAASITIGTGAKYIYLKNIYFPNGKLVTDNANAILDLEGNMVAMVFYATGLAANQSNTVMNSPGSAQRYPVYKSGVLVGIAAALDGSISAGSIALTAYVSGVSTGITLTMTSGNSASTISGAVDLDSGYSVHTGETVQLKYTTNAAFVTAGPDITGSVILMM